MLFKRASEGVFSIMTLEAENRQMPDRYNVSIDLGCGD